MTEGTTPIDIAGFRAEMREAGVEEVVESTLEVFAREAPGVYARLEAASAAGDARSAAAAAHALKSASANVWAHDLAETLGRIEASGRQGDAAQVHELLGELRPRFVAVMDYLARI